MDRLEVHSRINAALAFVHLTFRPIVPKKIMNNTRDSLLLPLRINESIHHLIHSINGQIKLLLHPVSRARNIAARAGGIVGKQGAQSRAFDIPSRIILMIFIKTANISGHESAGRIPRIQTNNLTQIGHTTPLDL